MKKKNAEAVAIIAVAYGPLQHAFRVSNEALFKVLLIPSKYIAPLRYTATNRESMPIYADVAVLVHSEFPADADERM